MKINYIINNVFNDKTEEERRENFNLRLFKVINILENWKVK